MKLEAPPPRQRVIERDGRLVVIDSGAPVVARPASRRGAHGSRWFEPTSFDGRGVLTTRAWYDLKGPRRLELDPGNGKIVRVVPLAAVIIILVVAGLASVFPWALIAIPALFRPKQWQAARARLTAWLDRFPAASLAQP